MEIDNKELKAPSDDDLEAHMLNRNNQNNLRTRKFEEEKTEEQIIQDPDVPSDNKKIIGLE